MLRLALAYRPTIVIVAIETVGVCPFDVALGVDKVLLLVFVAHAPTTKPVHLVDSFAAGRPLFD